MSTGLVGSDLRVIGIFADLSDDDLDWIAERSVDHTFEPGTILFQPGAAAEEMYFALEGTVEIRRSDRDSDAPTFMVRAGDVSGRVPFSRMKTFNGRARALTHVRIASFPASLFSDLLHRIPVLEPRLIGLLTDRVRDSERREHEYERFRLLGRISAGMAHELNNPVSAVRQAATELRERLDAVHRFTIEVVAVGVDAGSLSRLDGVRTSVAEREPPVLDPITRSEREEALTKWLTEAGVPDPWVSAATFVAAGVTCNDLSRASEAIAPGARKSALCWLEAGLASDVLLREASQSAARVSDLVAAVKAYTQMDRPSARESVDLRAGIDATLAIFSTRLSEKHITVTRQLIDLPRISVYVSDINQVWANLISNAIDAVEMGGHITIIGCRDDHDVRVDVIDDGRGIPEELQERIWEPFFTTKDVGKGTGLGLDIAQRIVVRRHGGTITSRSVPGETVFSVKLPLT